MIPSQQYFGPGDFVEVRSLQEILATLDKHGRLDGIPFMPEMLQFCGRVLPVAHHSNITCVELHGIRRMPQAVMLSGTRCDGSGHDGCQKLCPIMWKSAWLKSTNRRAGDAPPAAMSGGPHPLVTKNGDRYVCQATELLGAAAPVRWWDPRIYARNLVAGHQTLPDMVRDLAGSVRIRLSSAQTGTKRMPWGGIQSHTPSVSLNLTPGEVVEVLPFEQIRLTLDPQGRNRGLEFTPEMRGFCGRRLRVRGRVERVIFDTTGRMHNLSDTVMLEGAECNGGYHRGCSRNLIFHWREIWLRRTEDAAASGTESNRIPELDPSDENSPSRPQDPWLAKIEKLLTVPGAKSSAESGMSAEV